MPGNTGGSGSGGGNPIGFGPPQTGIFHPQGFRPGDILRPADCYKNAVLADGALSYWRLGEPSGTNAADELGVNAGTYTNAPTLAVTSLLPGDTNTAVTFAAGSSQYVEMTTTSYSLGNGPFSFTGAFKTNASGANFMLFDLQSVFGAGGEIGIALGPSANGKLSVMDGGNRIISSAASTYNDNNPHFYAVTKSVLNEWHLYVDGIDVGVDDATPHVSTSTDSGPWHNRIGSQYNAGTPRWFFTGTLDEIAVFGTELSAAQVRFQYDARLVACAITAQNLFLTTTDAVTTADVATRTGAFLRSATDAVTTADTVTRTAILLRTSTDAVTTADVVTRILSAFRTTTDAVSATQAATRTGTFLRSATDTLTSSDAATRIGAFLRTTTDAVTLSDVATDVKTKNATAADAVTTADTATRIGAFLRTGTDAVTTSDSALRTELDSRQGTDAVTTSESVTRLLAALRTSTDAVTVSETLSRLLVALRSTSDAVTASQVASRILAALRSTSDAVSTSDAATRLVTAARSVTDAVTTADTATRTEVLLRTATDALTLSDSVTATQNARSTTDTVTTSDTATVAQVLFRSAADSVTISDTATVSGGQASSGGGAVANPGYGKRVLREMTRQPDKKPSIERIRRETVLVATSDRLTIRDASVAVVEFTQDEADLEVLLGL